MWFGSVYFAAGMTNATKVLLPVYLADRGLSEFAIGVVVGLDDIGLATKIPAGLISDKFDLFGYGHRRPYVFVAMWITALAYFLRSVLDIAGFDYSLFVALIVFDSLVREFFDKPVDAYANEVTPDESVGRVQGIVMNAARGLALLLGFGIGTVASDAGRFGWAFKFTFDAAVLIAASFMVFKVPRVKVSNRFQWRAFMELRRPNLAFHAIFMFLGGIPTNIMLTAAPLYIQSATDTNVSTGSYLAIASITVFGGAMLMGTQFDKRRKQLPYVFATSLFVALVACAFFLLSIWTGIVQIMYLWGLCNGFTIGSLLAMNYGLLFLEIQDDAISGSMIGIFGTVSGCGSLTGGVLGGYLLEEIDYAPTIGVMCALIALNMCILVGMFWKQDYSIDRERIMSSGSASDEACDTNSPSSADVELAVTADVSPDEASSEDNGRLSIDEKQSTKEKSEVDLDQTSRSTQSAQEA